MFSQVGAHYVCAPTQRKAIVSMRPLSFISVLLLFTLLVQSCKLIDDDLSVCGKDFKLNYQMQLVTNMNMEINEELTALEDTIIKRSLRERMAPVFSDHAHDIDLSFYRKETGERAYYRNEVIDDNRTSFSFYLPKESYRHLSVANIADAINVNLLDTLTPESASLAYSGDYAGVDTLMPQTTGLFSARLDMEVNDSVDQEFEVNLYMVNSAMALVVDTSDVGIQGIKSFVVGSATAFMLNDSSYVFDRNIVMTTEDLDLSSASLVPHYMPTSNNITKSSDSKQMCMTSVLFPSASQPDEQGAYWGINVYVSMPDNTITETKLSMSTSLNAGELKIIKTKLNKSGGVIPVATTEVGATITLDWKPAGSFDPTW